MDYRIRWQERRRQRRQKQLLILPAVLGAALLVYLIVRLASGGGGNVYWVHEEPGHAIPHFAVGPALVYVVWSDGHVRALQQRTGESLTEGPFLSAPEAFNTTPLLADHVLYFGSDLGQMHAIDARSGQPLWTFDAQSPLRVPPLLVAGKLYFGSQAGKFYCFDLSGKKLWVQQLSGPLSAQAAVVGPNLIVSTIHGDVCALALADGKVLWRQALSAPIFSPVTAADPLVVVGSDTGYLYVLQAADGKLVERYYTDGLIRTAAAVDQTGLYFGSTDGWLRVVGRDGKTPLWAYDLGGPVTVGPVLSGECVYLGRPGRLVALDVKTGGVRRAWKDEDFAGDLVVSGGTVYVGTTNGRVLALAAP